MHPDLEKMIVLQRLDIEARRLNDEMAALPPTGSPEVYRRAVALTLIERRHATLETLHTRGVIPIDVPANRLTPEVINTYLGLKARGRV